MTPAVPPRRPAPAAVILAAAGLVLVQSPVVWLAWQLWPLITAGSPAVRVTAAAAAAAVLAGTGAVTAAFAALERHGGGGS